MSIILFLAPYYLLLYRDNGIYVDAQKLYNMLILVDYILRAGVLLDSDGHWFYVSLFKNNNKWEEKCENENKSDSEKI